MMSVIEGTLPKIDTSKGHLEAWLHVNSEYERKIQRQNTMLNVLKFPLVVFDNTQIRFFDELKIKHIVFGA